LICLDGPFWFDIVKRLTFVRQIVGSLIRRPPTKTETDSKGKSQELNNTSFTEDLRIAFKSVIRAQHVIKGIKPEVDKHLGPKANHL
jgi:hypothetical protein